MNIQYNETTQKWLIAILLFVSCVTIVLILTRSNPARSRQLKDFAQADSLIRETFDMFNIKSGQIDLSTVRTGTLLTRKTYTIHTPPGFSKTLLHAELNRKFQPLSVETPATVSLPEEDMRIHLLYEETVIRSVSIRTDPDLRLERYFASLMLAFEEIPTDRTIRRINRIREPIPLVVQVSSADEAYRVHQQIKDRYPDVGYWIKNGEQDDSERGISFLPPLAQFQEFSSGARILSFQDPESNSFPPSRSNIETASDKNLSFLDVSNAVILHSELGESVFKRELSKFVKSARNHEYPIAIVMASNESLSWLSESLVEHKRGGLRLVSPPETTF